MNNGSFNTNAYNNRYLRFEWWINNQDIAGNYTDIGWKVYGAGGSSTWYKTGPIYVSINGSNVHTTSGRINLANGTQVASGTYRLYHNNEGNILVKFLHNEKEIRLPMESRMSPYYDWECIKQQYAFPSSTLNE